jgi:hypothetical protein
MSIEPKNDQPDIHVADDEARGDGSSSTVEVARDLEDRKSTTGGRTETDKPTPLFPESEATNFRNRWTEIQTAFVDEPRRAVEQGDALVADVIKRLASSFAEERSKLERQWDRGDDVSTEDLRVALRRYRAFFDQLLNV